MAKALVKTRTGVGGVELQDVTTRPPSAGEVQIRVAAAGICGTDLHILDGEWPTEPPVVMGHELSGTIVQCGPDVSEDWLDVAVVSEVLIADGTCVNCVAGRRTRCLNRRAIGRLADGAFTQFVNVPVINVHRVPEGLDLIDAALAEPLACVLGAMLFPPKVAPADRVLVTGPGTVGLLAAQVARMAGGKATVVGTPRDGARLEIAQRLGFDTWGATASASASELNSQFDVAIECSGAVAAANLALTACTMGATYIQLGIFGKPAPIDIDQLCLKDISYATSYGASPAGMDKALAVLGSGAISARAMITHVAPLDEWESIFASTRAGEGLKYMFDPGL